MYNTIDNNIVDNTDTKKDINKRYSDDISADHSKGNIIKNSQNNSENLNNNFKKNNNVNENINITQNLSDDNKRNTNINQNISKENNTKESLSTYSKFFKSLDKFRTRIWSNQFIGTIFLILCCFLYFGTLFFGLSHIFKILTRYTRFNLNRGLSLIILGIGYHACNNIFCFI